MTSIWPRSAAIAAEGLHEEPAFGDPVMAELAEIIGGLAGDEPIRQLLPDGRRDLEAVPAAPACAHANAWACATGYGRGASSASAC